MTELQLAVDFISVFAEAVVVAVKSGEHLDENVEFRRFCDRAGVKPGVERLELAKDVAVVFREHYWSDEEDEGWVEASDLQAVPTRCIADGLERHGWRRDFLNQNVRV